MRNRIFSLLFLLTASLCSAADVQACSCIMSYVQYQPCSAYWNASVVFSGAVTEVGPMTPVPGSDGKYFTMQNRVTRFKVEEAFRGVSGEVVETYEEGTSCDYSFRVGERYFVYGSRNPKDGKVYVGSCSATKTRDRAAADLAFARGIERGEKTPSIVGFVTREKRETAAAYRSNAPLEGIKVTVERGKFRTSVLTDDKGTFRIFDLPAGTYRVTAATPPELRLLSYSGERTNDLQVNPGRCSGTGFTVTSLSTIRGRVVDVEGKPTKSRVNLLLVDEENKEIPQAENLVEVYTDELGNYKFDWVAPGRYLIAVNARNQPGSSDPPFPRTYYPGVSDAAEAKAITVVDSEQYEAEELHLPSPLTQSVIEGVVLMPDGRPAANALLTLEFTDREWIETGSTDAEGRFTFKVYEGFKYLVAGEIRKEIQGVWRGNHSLPVEIVVGVNNDPITLVITQQGFYRTRYARRKMRQ